MREIKFRAWEFEAEEFIYLNPNKEEFDSKWLKNDKQSICQQYTGFKDENSVEIYEGDIIRNHLTKALEITWENYPFAALSISEVIGNIFETANLLKEIK